MSKTFLFQTIQFSISMPLVLFNPYIGPYQVLPRRARVDLGAMAMKGCSAFPKAPASLGPHHPIVSCHKLDTHGGGGVLLLCRGAVVIFFSPCWLGNFFFACFSTMLHIFKKVDCQWSGIDSILTGKIELLYAQIYLLYTSLLEGISVAL